MLGKVSTLKFTLGFQVLTTLIFCALLIFIISQRSKTIMSVSANQRAVAYVCNTTNVIDTLAKLGAAQIAQNFKTHEYSALVAKGVLTEQDVRQARADLKEFKSADVLLQHNAACIAVLPKK